MPFNTMLKTLRLKKGLTQGELAKLTGLTRSAIGMYESGNREPKYEVLELLADFFNVDMNTLLDQSVPLTPRDERQIAADLEKMLADLDSKNSMAAMALGIKPSQLMGIGEPAGTSGPRIVKMPPIELNQPERELITKYRKLTDVAQDRVQKMVDFELYQQQQAAQEDAQKDARSCG